MELGKLAIYHGMEQSYYSSHLIGMKTLKELQVNLDVSTNGLNEKELSTLEEVKNRFVSTTGILNVALSNPINFYFFY